MLRDFGRSLLPTPVLARARVWWLGRNVARYAPRLVTQSIDDLAEEFGNPDVLFIDVEGCEGAVPRGARDRFDLFMAADTDQQPRPFSIDDPLTRGRFYLFAIARNGEPSHA